MDPWIHRAMLIPTGVIGHRSQQGSGICCSKHRLSADGNQCNTDRRGDSLHATSILPADGVPTSWDPDAIGSDAHHSVADDHIDIKKFVQHAAWIYSGFFLWDASRDDGRRMAAESEH